MAKNKIITSEGNVQFIFGDTGKVINVHPFHIYTCFNEDTVSFLLLPMPKSSGLSIFTSKAEDLEFDGETYSFSELPGVIAEAFAEAGAKARWEIVDTLPASGRSNTIYLVPKEEGTGYDEYIWIKDEHRWELIGDTDIELARYLKKSDFNVYSAATKDYIDSVSGKVDTEIERATSAETALSTAIFNESVDRAAADNVLSGAIDTVSSALTDEISARTEADSALDSKIDIVSGNVVSETTRAEGVENTLSGAIDSVSSALTDEISARTDADSALSDKIDYVSGAVDTEVSARGAADSYISGAVDTLSSVKADKADAVASAVYVSSSTTIDLKNISGEVISQVDASDFIVDGMVEDVRIENGYLIIDFNTASGIEDIEIPLTDIFNPANYYDKDAIDAIVSGINEDIADEVSARTDADTALQSAIDTVSGNVETETSRAESAETSLQTAINNEVSARTEAISGLTDRLGEDEEVCGAALNELNSDISALTDSLSGYVETSAFTAHTADSVIHITSAERTAWNAKSDFSGSYNDLTDKPTIPTVPSDVSAFNNDAGYITVDALSGKLDTSVFETYSGTVESAIAAKADPYGAGTNINITDNVISVTGVTIEVSSAITSGDTNAVAGGAVYDKFNEVEQVTARALVGLSEADEVAARALVDLNDKFGGLQLVKISQSDYDNLQVKDNNTLYIISD